MDDLLAILQAHPLTAGLSFLDKRVPGRAGTPAWIGQMEHHTVSNPPADIPSLNICINGRPDVAGPLCNFLIGRSGLVVGITDGEANHAGTGDPDVLTRMRADLPPKSRPGPDQANTNARKYLIGFECENNGTGEPWGAVQLDAMARCNAAFCDHYGWDPMTRVIGHKEWTTRKIDPAFITPPITMTQWRERVAALLDAPPDPTPDPGDEWMPKPDWFDADVARIVDERIANAFGVPPGAIAQKSRVNAFTMGGSGQYCLALYGPTPYWALDGQGRGALITQGWLRDAPPVDQAALQVQIRAAGVSDCPLNAS